MLRQVIKVKLPKDLFSEEALKRYPLLGFEVAPSRPPMKKSNLNFGPDESILEGTRMILVNKKNIYTVSVGS